MDYGNILKRSWHMVTSYRALWIFGIVLGLFTFSWGTTLLSDMDYNQPHFEPINVTRMPNETFYDALERAWQSERIVVEQELSRVRRELDQELAKAQFAAFQ